MRIPRFNGNQYVTVRRNVRAGADWIYIKLVLLFVFILLADLAQTAYNVAKQAYIHSPVVLVKNYSVEAKERPQTPEIPHDPAPTATPTPYEPPKGDIADEIRRVFGPYSDQAFRILSCENGRLNPEATNVNVDGSTDMGVFQLNSYWHGFNRQVNNPRYLFDPIINIRIAWHIFEGSGYKWGLWMCAKKVGLQ